MPALLRRPPILWQRAPREALRFARSRADQPGIADMTRQAAFRHQHDVEAQRQSGMLRMRGEELLEGARDPAPLPRRDRLARRRQAVARLDLDRREDAAAPRDDVDLADGDPIAARQDAVAAQTQMPDAERLRRAPAPPGAQALRAGVAVAGDHCPPSPALPLAPASARARV